MGNDQAKEKREEELLRAMQARDKAKRELEEMREKERELEQELEILKINQKIAQIQRQRK